MPNKTQAESASPVPLKTIALLGGISPESTTEYYRKINDGVREELGAFNSARMLIYSINLQDAFTWIYRKQHDALATDLVKAATSLEAAGADFVILACNTAHAVAPQIESSLGIPFVHIVDALGEALQAAGRRKVGFLASRQTSDLPFYHERLRERFGIETVVPAAKDCAEVDRVIREELCFHDFRPASRQRFEEIAASLADRGADSVALACTEIGLLITTPELAGLPVFDTTALHCKKAVHLALAPSEISTTVAA